MPKSTLVLKLAAPLQAWGVKSRFRERETNAEPTKSAIIGLISSALGRSRETPIDDLNDGLFYAVRVEQPGVLLRDYQTARSLDGKGSTRLSTRYYLSDAKFLVALEGDDALLDAVEHALTHPHYAPYLGRRSCPANWDLIYGRRDEPARDALAAEPWQATQAIRRREPTTVALPVVSDALPGEAADSVKDLAISFSPQHRDYAWRSTVRYEVHEVPNPDGKAPVAAEAQIDDPYFAEVQES